MDPLIRGANGIYWGGMSVSDDVGPENTLPTVEANGELSIQYPVGIEKDFPPVTVKYSLNGPTHPEDVVRAVYNFYQQKLSDDNIEAYKQKNSSHYGHLQQDAVLANVFSQATRDVDNYNLLGLVRSGNGYRALFGFGDDGVDTFEQQGLGPS